MAVDDLYKEVMEYANNPMDLSKLQGYHQEMRDMDWSKKTTAAMSDRANRDYSIMQQKNQERASQIQAELEALGYGKWIRHPKEDGGFDFTDPVGNPVTAIEYAQARNVSLKDALQESTNISDRMMLKEYEDLQDLIEISTKGEGQLSKTEQDRLDAILDENEGTGLTEIITEYQAAVRNKDMDTASKIAQEYLLNPFMQQYARAFGRR